MFAANAIEHLRLQARWGTRPEFLRGRGPTDVSLIAQTLKSRPGTVYAAPGRCHDQPQWFLSLSFGHLRTR